MKQEIIDLYDTFTHGGMTRRTFMTLLAGLVGGMPAAFVLLPKLENQSAQDGLIPVDDAEIVVEYITFVGMTGTVRAYLAKPEGDGPFPAVVVIHENRGLNPHIEDVARRAAAGFWAIAPDALSPLGGTPTNTDEARSLMGGLDRGETDANFAAAVTFAAEHEMTNGRVGCVGFCWGGGMANRLAIRSPELNAAVAFYGSQPDTDQVPQISAALMLHYAGLDTRINAGIEEYQSALDQSGKDYDLYLYEGVNHAFHNDTSPNRYDEAAATLAWERSMDFFNRHLRE